MGSTPISTTILLTSLAAVVLVEAAGGIAGQHAGIPHLWTITAVRTVQAVSVMAIAAANAEGLRILGMDRRRWILGCKMGLVWSAGFAVAAGILFLVLLGMGQHPLSLIRSPLPTGDSQQLLYFIVGGVVAPVAEEIVFRGLIFGYLRRWGVTAAVLISTALFAALHLPAIPVTQIVGGVVFAIAYHLSGSLITPIMIHVLGNLAIFTLSLPVLR